MSTKSEASKANWAKLSPEERSKRMSLLATRKWSKISKNKRKDLSFKMVQARLNKKNETGK